MNIPQYINIKVLQKFRKTRNIYMICQSYTMLSHLIKYYDVVKDNPNFHFYITYTYTSDDFDNDKIIGERKIIKIKKIKGKYLKLWDLIVVADLEFIGRFYSVPHLYINHGLHIVSRDHGKNAYAYIYKTPYRKMLESNKYIADVMQNNDEFFRNRVAFVGCKDCDEILENFSKYDLYRKNLSVTEEETLVLVFGSWNDISLFHMIGKELIAEMKKLVNKQYKFILSIHPMEYKVYNQNIEPLGDFINQQASEPGFIVRMPDEDYIPYLVASDIVICDHSSMYELALLCGKKLILSDIPEHILWEHSIAKRIKEKVPILKQAVHLETILQQVMEKYDDAIFDFADEIRVGKGEYQARVKNITNNLLNI